MMKMKLIFYLRHYPPFGTPLVGGTATAVDGLVKGLGRLHQDVTILCEGDSASNYTTSDGIRIISFRRNTSRNPFSISPDLKQFLSAGSEKPDIIILNGCFNPALFTVARIACAAGIPYVAASHTHYHPALFNRRPYLKWPYWHLIEKRFLARAKAVQVYDMGHTEYLKGLGLKTIYLAVPNGFFPENAPASMNHRPQKKGPVRIVFRGRLDAYHKGLDLLFRAIAQLRSDHAMQVFIQGPDLGDKVRLVKLAQQLSISSNVTFVEPDYSPPYSFLVQQDVFVLTSRFEGFGIAALEAMLAGLVVLATDSAGIAPYVQRSGCGVLVKADGGSIAAGLRHLISMRDDWSEMGRKGRQYVMEHLTWTQIADKALNDYRQLS